MLVGDSAILVLTSSSEGDSPPLSFHVLLSQTPNDYLGAAGIQNTDTWSTGSAFAIKDATVLANSLLNNPPTSDPFPFQAALQEYDRTRVPRSRQIAKTAYWAHVLSLGEKWHYRLIRVYGTKWTRFREDCRKYVFQYSFRVNEASGNGIRKMELT